MRGRILTSTLLLLATLGSHGTLASQLVPIRAEQPKVLCDDDDSLTPHQAFLKAKELIIEARDYSPFLSTCFWGTKGLSGEFAERIAENPADLQITPGHWSL